MKLSELIQTLTTYKTVHGDVEVKIADTSEAHMGMELNIASLRLLRRDQDDSVVGVLLCDQVAAESLL